MEVIAQLVMSYKADLGEMSAAGVASFKRHLAERPRERIVASTLALAFRSALAEDDVKNAKDAEHEGEEPKMEL
eukprot:CAMPEP_0174742346 /NCGR_PEP_ID=MMETSP1094-20130205/78658_1 /TAXON_ID=156173 /ORGANISM="Chrysochromulina brevifilum, Strain UTEX LB 985" /LENGTH=73 /DNA_ID=CAMNT_0015946383 /DNA_START=6 /DNA_END=227 /DNA_ORIENTATION=+